MFDRLTAWLHRQMGRSPIRPLERPDAPDPELAELARLLESDDPNDAGRIAQLLSQTDR